MTNLNIIDLAKELATYQKLDHNNTAGKVAAIIYTFNKNIYKGLNIEIKRGIGFCAEHSAIAAMITAGETKINKIVAVKKNEISNKWAIIPPCGRCREFIYQINGLNLESEIILGIDKSTQLKKLLPLEKYAEPLD